MNIPRNIAGLLAMKGLALAAAAWLLFHDPAYSGLALLLGGLATLSFILAVVVPIIGETPREATRKDATGLGDPLS